MKFTNGPKSGLTNDEAVLQADPRYPRTDREIASRLIKTCKRGRFGLVFQQMVEAERAASGAMPCGARDVA